MKAGQNAAPDAFVSPELVEGSIKGKEKKKISERKAVYRCKHPVLLFCLDTKK